MPSSTPRFSFRDPISTKSETSILRLLHRRSIKPSAKPSIHHSRSRSKGFTDKMQRGRGGMDDFFGFGAPFGGFNGVGGPGSMISSFFGGRDPFDDPFFTQPFGGMLGPSMFGPSMFGPSMFGSERRFFGEPSNVGFLEQQGAPAQRNGPIIEEISSDDEGEEGADTQAKEKKENPRKHSRSRKEPYVEDPDDETEETANSAEKKSKHMQYSNGLSMANRAPPQGRSYSFHSSSVTYGGANGAYYTSSTTRRTGGNGVTVEERKEADSTTGRATHKLSRGIREKGHSVTRKLNDDGRVETMQTLHNLNEDELSGFEEAWKGSARQHLPGWNQNLDILDNGNTRSGQRDEPSARGGWALPSTEQRPRGSERARVQSRPNSFNVVIE